MQYARFVRKLLSLFLVLTILSTLLVPAVSADPGAEQEVPEESQSIFSAPAEEADAPAEETLFDADEIVRVSIVLEAPSTLEKGFSMDGVSKNPAAVSYRNSLRAEQDAALVRMEAATGTKIGVKWHLTLAANIISAELRYGDIPAIKQVPGVKDVFPENRYEPLPVERSEVAEPNTSITSSDMVGAAAAWAEGYTGAGSRIAIIDTGLDLTHQSVDADAFDYAIAQTGKQVDLFDKTELSTLLTQLNAFTEVSNKPTADALYRSTKVPFGYNYIDSAYYTQIDHMNDTQGEHGSHVAGIAAANRYIKDGSSFVDAASNVFCVGMAPDAQLFIMKVFGAGGGAYDSDYMAAIEDAIILDCDVVNLSLGSASPGSAYSDAYQDIMNRLSDASANTKLVVSISAGNEGAFTDQLTTDLYIDDVSMHTGGTPGTLINSLCVASADNTGVTGMPLYFNGDQRVFYTETDSTGAKMATIAGSYDFVYIDAVGTGADYSAVNAAASLSGKVVLVNRGEITFVDKGNNAKPYNPKALIVVNNDAGTVNMGLDDYTGSFPMVFIMLADGNTIKANSTKQTVGSYTYYTGSVQVTDSFFSEVIYDNPEMSSFSSWGVPGSLMMKLEITAPGGNIYSIYGTNKTQSGSTAGGSDQYESMSGTSMAAPHIAGLTGTLTQYLRENNLSVAGHTTRQLVQSLLMSTAVPMHEGSADGNYYPVLQQGAGLANVSRAIHASSALFMGSDATISYADGKVKAELGDKPGRSGSYNWSFEIHNLAAQAQSYRLSTDLFTQDRYEEEGEAFMAQSTTPLSWPVSYSTGSTVTVPAGGSKSVTVTITIPADMSEFDALYPSGAYVEGFTYVESQTTTADGAKLDVVHSIPILGFYGAWTDPSMFDNMSYLDSLYGADRTPYSGCSDTNYMSYVTGGVTKKVQGNPYLIETPFPAERMAMKSSDTISSFAYNLVRSAGATGFAVSKLDTADRVVSVLQSSVTATGVLGLWYYNSTYGWQNTATKTYSVDKTVDSFGLSEADRFRVGFYAVPEYNAMQVNTNLSSASAGKLSAGSFKKLLLQNTLGNGAMVGYDFTVDDHAPEIIGAYRQGNQITVTVRDNNYIACLGLSDSTGKTFYRKVVPEQSEKGQIVVYTFDASGVTGGCYVFAGDYACNQTLVQPVALNYTVTAASANESFGTVSVAGYTVIAEPAEGYAVSGVTVVSGSAQYEIIGNVIAVSPSSDCSLRVSFSARPVVSVSYRANGVEEESVNCYLNDTITLKDSISNEVEGYSFSGWVDTTFAETAEQPSFYAPGTSYTVLGSVTLYALYTRHEGPEGLSYALCTEMPEQLPGNYIISSSADPNGYIMMNYDGGYNYNYDAAVWIAGSGAVLEGTTLNDAQPEMVFTVRPSSNDPGKYNILPYTINGVYLAAKNTGLGVNESDNDNSQWSFSCTDGRFYILSDAYNYMSLGLATSYFSSDVYFDTVRNGSGVNLWLEQPAGVDYYTTNPITTAHEHEMTCFPAVAPTCGDNGHTAYYHCEICGKYFSDPDGEHQISLADTVIPATGNHNYDGASCSTNNDGTHDHVCTVCGQTATESCTYEDVVTPPTQTSQGYTTHTCIYCGYSFKDSFIPALGNTFTVTFSVFGNTTVIAPMESNTNTGITLPTAQAPAGYKFLGWVTDNYDNVTARPTGILNGNYVAVEDITLYALFSRVEGGTGEVVYTLQTEAPADWAGRWVITRGKSGSFYVLTGIAAGSYESNTSGGATGYISSGMTLEDTILSNVAEKYVFEVERKGDNYSIRNAEKNSYLSQTNSLLYAVNDYAASTCDWEFSMTQYGYVNIKNANSTSYPYIGCSSYFMCTVSTGIDLSLWCETPSGTTFYTTVEPGEHVHTVAHHDEEPATCTEDGVKAYYYCSDPNCPLAGMKFEDEALTVELTDVVIPAPGHDWDSPRYTWSDDNNTATATRICKRDNTHKETETVATTSVVTVEPTEEQEGEIVYTAEFQNPAFETQTKTVVLPKLGEPTLPCDGGEGCPGKVFADMPVKGHWAHNAIDWAIVKKITSGTTETTFSPYQMCTRGQALTFLWRAAGSPEPESMENPFTDVEPGSYYEKAVLWAVSLEITAGTSETTFSPYATCTRAQIVTFLWKFAGSPEPETTVSPFRDLDRNAYYATAVLWAWENGITAGTTTDRFSPDTVCNRAQVVTFLYRERNR